MERKDKEEIKGFSCMDFQGLKKEIRDQNFI